jgi:transposase
MAAWRRAIELSLGDSDLAKLRLIARLRTEPASRVERARILLGYRENSSFFAVGQALGLHHQTVQRCVERAVAEGPMAALDDRPRPGREPSITLEAKAWLTSLSCRKAKELGYPHELWTTRLLARHAREHGPAEGHPCLANLAQGSLCKILDSEEVKPHKVRYYLEKRDPEFAKKMAEVLCVYRKVKLLKKGGGAVEAEAERPGGDCLLRRKARYSGDCNDVRRSAARARCSSDLRPRP